MAGIILCDGNYGVGAYGMEWVHMAWSGCIWHGVGAYGMEWVHNKEPE